jgi:hypothetical protein
MRRHTLSRRRLGSDPRDDVQVFHRRKAKGRGMGCGLAVTAPRMMVQREVKMRPRPAQKKTIATVRSLLRPCGGPTWCGRDQGVSINQVLKF